MSRHRGRGLYELAYAVALRLFPHPFRRRFGRSMQRDFESLLRSAPGPTARFVTAARELANVLRSAAGERRGARHHGVSRYGPGPSSSPSEHLWQLLADLRVGARSLLGQRAYAATAIATAALGIAVSTIVFGLVDGVFLRPLPFENADRLAWLTASDTSRDGWDHMQVTSGDYLEWERLQSSFDCLAAVRFQSAVVTGGGHPDRVTGVRITPSVFALLGVEPALGRRFATDDVEAGRDDLVIVSDALWRNLLGADASIVGTAVHLDGSEHTVIGVMPPDFEFPIGYPEIGIWRPLVFTPADATDRVSQSLSVYGRLAAGVGWHAATTEMEALAARQSRAHPTTNDNRGAAVHRYRREAYRSAVPTLALLAGAAILVQLLVWVNLAGLGVARGIARTAEIATRVALGARSWQVSRLLIGEAMLVTIAAAAAGLVLAQSGLAAIRGVAPSWPPPLAESALDVRAFAFACVVAATTVLLAGLAPSMRVPWRGHAADSGPRAVGGSAREQRLRNILVAAQIGLALVLLVGFGLLSRAAATVLTGDPQIDTTGLVTARVWRGAAGGASTSYYEELLRHARAIPGVTVAGLADVAPLSGGAEAARIVINGEQRESPTNYYGAAVQRVDDAYFETVGIGVVRGRGVRLTDRLGSERVAVISEAFARHYFGEQDPLGQLVRPVESSFGHEGASIEVPWRVVGVAADIREYGFEHPFPATLYVPYAQAPAESMVLVMRAAGGLEQVLAPLRELVWTHDGGRALQWVRDVEGTFRGRYAAQRFALALLTGLSFVAVVIAAVGQYGVMAHDVERRVGEIGLRMALGARGGDIWRLVIGRGLAVTTVAICLGALSAAPFAHWLSQLNRGRYVIGATWRDPLLFGAAALLLLVVSLVACAAPARRAAGLDPGSALR